MTTVGPATGSAAPVRLTSYARGGGCACKIPPGELEAMVAGLLPPPSPGQALGRGHAPGPGQALGGDEDRLLVGLEDGDDAAVVRTGDGTAVVSTADFFTPVVDDARDWGRIAAANALSDVYAMGGRPLVGLNLLGWPRDVLPAELAGEVLAGALDVARAAGCLVGGGHSIDSPEPLYGMAVTGLVDPDRLLRNDAGRPGVPLTLTKPLGVGILNNRHKRTGEVFAHAVAGQLPLRPTQAELAYTAQQMANSSAGFSVV
ncbi:selenide, water dikinase SelD, partial [Streptomyces niveus]|uniref:selenide, water dikinase SelD n=1 Tax=Streptomyces niveus TaxID=193462 RepID=UPI00342B3D79